MIGHDKEVYEEFRKSNPNLNLSDEEIALIISTRELSSEDVELLKLHIREIAADKDRQKGQATILFKYKKRLITQSNNVGSQLTIDETSQLFFRTFYNQAFSIPNLRNQSYREHSFFPHLLDSRNPASE